MKQTQRHGNAQCEKKYAENDAGGAAAHVAINAKANLGIRRRQERQVLRGMHTETLMKKTTRPATIWTRKTRKIKKHTPRTPEQEQNEPSEQNEEERSQSDPEHGTARKAEIDRKQCDRQRTDCEEEITHGRQEQEPIDPNEADEEQRLTRTTPCSADDPSREKPQREHRSKNKQANPKQKQPKKKNSRQTTNPARDDAMGRNRCIRMTCRKAAGSRKDPAQTAPTRQANSTRKIRRLLLRHSRRKRKEKGNKNENKARAYNRKQDKQRGRQERANAQSENQQEQIPSANKPKGATKPPRYTIFRSRRETASQDTTEEEKATNSATQDSPPEKTKKLTPNRKNKRGIGSIPKKQMGSSEGREIPRQDKYMHPKNRTSMNRTH